MCIYGHVLNKNIKENNEIFMNQFAVRIEGGNDAADRIASKHGFVNLGEVRDQIYYSICIAYVLIGLGSKSGSIS